MMNEYDFALDFHLKWMPVAENAASACQSTCPEHIHPF